MFDAFSADEQSCIRNVLGDEQLELVLSQRLMSEAASEQLDARLQDCLAPETAAGIILSVFIGQMEGLSAEAEACMRGLIADADRRRSSLTAPGQAQTMPPPVQPLSSFSASLSVLLDNCRLASPVLPPAHLRPMVRSSGATAQEVWL